MSRTIVAAATPTGGAIALIRISGEKTFELINKLCVKRIEKPRFAYYTAIDTGEVKDKSIVIRYEKDSSYTGEESAEIYCHGSKVIVREIIKFFVNNGATVAERGEFTLRAYENKRLDLTEAEGVLDLINSETVEQAVNAYKNADGELKKQITELQNKLKSIIAAVEVVIDYPEENIEEETINSSKAKVKEIACEIKKLIDSFNDGRKIKDGVKVVITGKPNVGKSSLFNALIGYKRAIVNETEGTTRDFIESEYLYKGRKFVLVDTAGIRSAQSEAEKEGIELAKRELTSADIVVGVGICGDEYQGQENVIAVTNKCDKQKGANFSVSALTGQGIQELKEEIYKRTDFEVTGLKINNLRQYEALVKTNESLYRAIDNTLTADCFAADLNEAFDSLGTVTGVIGSDEIIAEIFSAFCVGK